MRSSAEALADKDASKIMDASWRKRLLDWALLLFALWVVGLYFVGLNFADFRFPPPERDEGYFLYPAWGLAQTGTLQSDHLNQARPIMWMPPLHTVIHAGLFSVSGLSLEAARGLSAFFALSSAFFLFLLAAHFGRLWLALLLVGLFLLNRYFLILGNVARMEALVLALVTGGFLLLVKGRGYLGLALLALAPLAHPNGAYFLLTGLLWFFLSRRKSKPRLPSPRWLEWLAFFLVALCWLGYGLFVISHFDFFRSDMAYQFLFKRNFNQENPIMLSQWLVFFLPLGALVLLGLKRRTKAWPLIFLALPAFLAYAVGRMFWYEIYAVVGFLLLGLFGLTLLFDWLDERFSKPNQKGFLFSAKALFLLGLLLLFYLKLMIELPWAYPARFAWNQYKLDWSIEYLSDEDKEAVLRFLKAHKKSKGVTKVHYYPKGEGLLFQQMLSEDEFLMLQPTFTTMTPDLTIIRLSRFLPDWELAHAERFLKQAGIDPKDKASLFHARDKSELWFFKEGAYTLEPME